MGLLSIIKIDYFIVTHSKPHSPETRYPVPRIRVYCGLIRQSLHPLEFL
jgi:hypothetical protein